MKRTFFSLKFKFYNFYLNKSKVWLFCLLPCLLLPAGCSKKNDGLSAGKSSISNNTISEKPADKPAIKKFNYDFTKMNYNMISSLLFDFIINPKKYADKTVKMDGQFETSVYEGKRYFAVIKWDLTGCCPAGLDFEPPEDLNFPEDFPEKGTSITVSGVLKYQEDQEDNTALGKLNFVAYDIKIGE